MRSRSDPRRDYWMEAARSDLLARPETPAWSTVLFYQQPEEPTSTFPNGLESSSGSSFTPPPVPITPDPQKTLQPFCRSFGSKGNEDSLCTPCLFYTRMVCNDGLNCRFCHLQHKPRKRSKKRARHTENILRPGNLNPLVDHQTIHPIRTRHGTRLPPRMWCRSRVARDLWG